MCVVNRTQEAVWVEYLHGFTKTKDRVPKSTEQYQKQMKKTISRAYQEVVRVRGWVEVKIAPVECW